MTHDEKRVDVVSSATLLKNLDRWTAPIVPRAAETGLITARDINIDWGVPVQIRDVLILLAGASPLIWSHKRRDEACQQSEAMKRAWWILSRYSKSVERSEIVLPLGTRLRTIDSERSIYEVRSDISAGDAAIALHLHQRLASLPNSIRSALCAASRDEAVSWLRSAMIMLRLCIDAHQEAING